MPGTAWAVSRSLPRLLPTWSSVLGLDVILNISALPQRFALARLPGPCLTRSCLAFSATLSTLALDQRTLRWFAASPCRAAAEDLPPSPAQHRVSRPLAHGRLPRSWHTRITDRLRTSRSMRSSAFPFSNVRTVSMSTLAGSARSPRHWRSSLIQLVRVALGTPELVGHRGYGLPVWRTTWTAPSLNWLS